MHKVNFNNLDQDLYSFTLKNNLKVYLMPFKDKKNYYAVLGTKYGSMDIDFTVNTLIQTDSLKHFSGLITFPLLWTSMYK